MTATPPDPRTRVKVCCIQSGAEARTALDLGAHALGLVSAMPSGPGPLPEERIAEILAGLPSGVRTFLLTSLLEPEAVARQWVRCPATTIQFVDRLAPGDVARVRGELPGVGLVQVVHVTGPASVEDAVLAALEADAVLLDSGRPDADRRVLGGTGRTHDWAVSAEIVRRLDVPVYLAGGLHADNVAEAIRAVNPYGVDVCSGVRTDDRLDAGKLSALMDTVRAAGDSPADRPRPRRGRTKEDS